MSKTGKGCQAVPSWFSIPLGPPVRAWGSTGRLAGRFCRAAAHTTAHSRAHNHRQWHAAPTLRAHYTLHTAPIWTHRKAVNPKFQQTIFLLALIKGFEIMLGQSVLIKTITKIQLGAHQFIFLSKPVGLMLTFKISYG